MPNTTISVNDPAIRAPQANVRDPADIAESAAMRTIERVPVFAEHEIEDKHGRKLVFNYQALQAVAEACNARIRKTGDYAAVVVGHTPDESAKGQREPITVGFAGPFEVARMGKTDKKWCIVADLHIYKKYADAVEKYPRRSAELWIPGDGSGAPDYSQMFLDPIALLGSTPRLDLGLFYSAAHADGMTCLRYAAATMPAMASVSVPAPVPAKSHKKYSAGDAQVNLSPEDVRAIVEALMQTDVMQKVQTMIASQESPAATENAAAEGAPPPAGEAPPEAQPAAPEAPAEGAPPAGDPMPDADNRDDSVEAPPVAGDHPEPDADNAGGPPDGDADNAPSPAAAEGESEEDDDDEDEQKKPYCAGKCGSKKKYSQLEAENQRLLAELHQARAAVTDERAQRVDAERRGKLTDMSTQFSFDVEREAEICRYAKMNDEQFATHLSCIESNYKPVQMGVRLPSGASKSPPAAAHAQQIKYSMEQSNQAFKWCEQRASRGQAANYKEALDILASGGTLPPN